MLGVRREEGGRKGVRLGQGHMRDLYGDGNVLYPNGSCEYMNLHLQCNCTELNLFTNEYRHNQGSLNPITFNINILVVTGYQVQAVQHVTTGTVRVPRSLQLRVHLQLSQNKESDC